MKNLITVTILAFLSFLSFSQCPDSKSNEYKAKLKQYGDMSYATLAKYYYFKCQCENGIGGRTPEQVNSMVDEYNRLKEHSKNQTGFSSEGRHQVEWITINKISKCSSGSDANSTNNSTTTNSNSTTSKFEQEVNEVQNLVGEVANLTNNETITGFVGTVSSAVDLGQAAANNDTQGIVNAGVGLLDSFFGSGGNEYSLSNVKLEEFFIEDEYGNYLGGIGFKSNGRITWISRRLAYRDKEKECMYQFRTANETSTYNYLKGNQLDIFNNISVNDKLYSIIVEEDISEYGREIGTEKYTMIIDNHNYCINPEVRSTQDEKKNATDFIETKWYAGDVSSYRIFKPDNDNTEVKLLDFEYIRWGHVKKDLHEIFLRHNNGNEAYEFRIPKKGLEKNTTYEAFHDNGNKIFSFETNKKGEPNTSDIEVFDRNGNIVKTYTLTKNDLKIKHKEVILNHFIFEELLPENLHFKKRVNAIKNLEKELVNSHYRGKQTISFFKDLGLNPDDFIRK